MKKIITILLVLCQIGLFAQEKVYRDSNNGDVVSRLIVNTNSAGESKLGFVVGTDTVYIVSDGSNINIIGDTIRINGKIYFGAKSEELNVTGVLDSILQLRQDVNINLGKDTSGIFHYNRTALNNVSGINTGDQDLSNYWDITQITNEDTTRWGLSPTETDPIFSAWDQSAVTHDNRASLDLVSGTNTGDQDLSDYWNITQITPEDTTRWGQGSPASDIAYDATTWNDNTDAATKNAIRDKFESLSVGGSVTSVTSATTEQLTVVNPTTTPELSITTASVSQGSAALTTGDQVYQYIDTYLTNYFDPCFASLYKVSGTGVSIPVLNTWYDIHGWTRGDVVNINSTVDGFIITNEGQYEIIFSSSWNYSEDLSFVQVTLFKNSVEVPEIGFILSSSTRTGETTPDYLAGSISGQINCSISDTLELKVRSDKTGVFTPIKANFAIKKISN